MFNYIKRIREDTYNIQILNYISMIYLLSLMLSYKISGTLLYIIFLIFLLNKNFKEHFSNSLKNKFVQACIAYFLVIVIWMLGSENLSYALAQIKINKFFLSSIVLVAIIRQDFIYKFLYVFCFGLVINLCWIYLIFFGFIARDHYLLMPLDQSFVIFLGISFSLYRLVKYDDQVKYKILLIILICVATVSIFMLKKTEMVLYLFVVFSALSYIYKQNIFKMVTTFFIFILVTFGIINYVLPSVKNNLIREIQGVHDSIIKNDYTKSMAARIGVAKYSLDVISENLFFGVGTGGHSFEVRKKIDESDLKINSNQSYQVIRDTLMSGEEATLHNTFLQVLVQFGIVGFMIYLNIFYQISKYISATINIKSCLLITMLVTVLLRFNTGWDFQFGNLGKLFILLVVIMISTKVLKKDSIQII